MRSSLFFDFTPSRSLGCVPVYHGHRSHILVGEGTNQSSYLKPCGSEPFLANCDNWHGPGAHFMSLGSEELLDASRLSVS